ncbi:MAG: hypothetical protein IT292_06205 [Deltaproteobacteria bacterium]|nr:hypothetical protein [Deltaproteobacteria bacterium]
MGELWGMWDDDDETLTITRESGQSCRVNGRNILAGSHRVFGVQTVGEQIHVLTGPNANRRPTRRVKYNRSGGYLGSSRL